ncbi:hypothetical protein BDZ91DRAFT_850593 [Kalaharituber pfeilii]|nr:hypothetical protein BDZ91DRAFT_850593 [Kalaharituber pfeilii]
MSPAHRTASRTRASLRSRDPTTGRFLPSTPTHSRKNSSAWDLNNDNDDNDDNDWASGTGSCAWDLGSGWKLEGGDSQADREGEDHHIGMDSFASTQDTQSSVYETPSETPRSSFPPRLGWWQSPSSSQNWDDDLCATQKDAEDDYDEGEKSELEEGEVEESDTPSVRLRRKMQIAREEQEATWAWGPAVKVKEEPGSYEGGSVAGSWFGDVDLRIGTQEESQVQSVYGTGASLFLPTPDSSMSQESFYAGRMRYRAGQARDHGFDGTRTPTREDYARGRGRQITRGRRRWRERHECQCDYCAARIWVRVRRWIGRGLDAVRWVGGTLMMRVDERGEMGKVVAGLRVGMLGVAMCLVIMLLLTVMHNNYLHLAQQAKLRSQLPEGFEAYKIQAQKQHLFAQFQQAVEKDPDTQPYIVKTQIERETGYEIDREREEAVAGKGGWRGWLGRTERRLARWMRDWGMEWDGDERTTKEILEDIIYGRRRRRWRGIVDLEDREMGEEGETVRVEMARME